MNHKKIRGTYGAVFQIFSVMPKMRSRAFSLTEVLLALIILGILCAASVGALWMFFNSFSQIDDYISAEFQLNHAVQRISREFALIGLGMPNNRDGSGSFAWSFRADNMALPITAFFAPPMNTSRGDAAWRRGGPVTVADGNSQNGNVIPAALGNFAGAGGPNRDLFVGSQLFYAWAVPTGVMAIVRGVGDAARPLHAERGTHMWLETMTATPGEDILRGVMWDGRPVGLLPVNEMGGGSHNVRSWVLFPTLRIPMLANSFDVANPSLNITNSLLNVTIAPTVSAVNAPQLSEPEISDLDEIHLLQAARIYRDAASNELRRVILTEPVVPGVFFSHEVLARNVVGLQFAFDPESRVLTMFAAARGNDRNPIGIQRGQQPGAWPNWLPPIGFDGPNDDPNNLNYRIVVKTLAWRIRN